MALQSIAQFPVIKGIVASNQPLAQPKGAVSRDSNLLLTSRGALTPCDGTGIINWYNGAVQSNRGQILAETLFTPTGVTPYYLALAEMVAQKFPTIIAEMPLGTPQNLVAADGGPGGTLAAATYFYKITALDGAIGETLPSNEASVAVAANHKINLTWNVVPNAFGYQVYRSTSSGTETLLVGTVLPVLQPSPLTTTVSFTDTGFLPAGAVPVVTATIVSVLVNGVLTSSIEWQTSAPMVFTPGENVIGAGLSNATFDGAHTVLQVFSPTFFSTTVDGASGAGATGGTISASSTVPPLHDITRQTALYQMPLGAIPQPYSDANIVALFPSAVKALNIPPFGSIGGGSNAGQLTSTVNGGIPGMVSLIPQFEQFTNRMIIALGNGFRPQAFSDATGTLTNPAFIGTISAISVDAFGVVTITTTTNHGLDPTQAIGANVFLQGIANNAYNTNGNGASAFVVIAIPATNQVKIVNLNAIGQAPSSGGTMTVTTIPLISTFVPAYPPWSASTQLAIGDLIVPVTQPSPPIYLTVIQGGVTAAAEPIWPTGGVDSIGKHVQEASPGTVIYTVSGLLNSGAPAPPGAAHISVYSAALWVFNTFPTNTPNGLDGPCSIRMCSINNPNSWNPVNQAFLDKDDGSEGAGLAKFTITAQGIPPQGSLVAFKNYSPYQLIGVFGAANFQIQAVSSDMGCLSPRTIVFVPGFGIARYSHLGVAVFNGVKDEIISEQIRPYLFPDFNRNFSDITAIDSSWMPVAWSALTANPPQYAMAAPVGNSFGTLTRIFAYDLVLKAWDVVDLGNFFTGTGGGGGGGGGGIDPSIAISSMAQVRSTVSNPITILGGFLDGVLSRWQGGDLQWYTGGGASATAVGWSFRTLSIASNDTDQRVYTRRLVLTGTNTGASGTITVTVNQGGTPQFFQVFNVAANSDFDIDFAVQLTGKRFDATVQSNLDAEIDGCTWEIEPRPAGVVVSI